MKLPPTRMHDLRHTAATTTKRLYGHVIGLDEVRASREIDKTLGRHIGRHRARDAKKPT